MSFVSPLLLFGLGAAAIPVIIHLIGRQRAPRRSFAALDFLLVSNRKVARKLKLRQFLLLAVRAFLLASVAMMMAKPFTETASDLPAIASQQQQNAVIILDDTLSMRRKIDGETLLAKAKIQAQQLVTLLGAQASIAVLRVSEAVGPLPMLSRDKRKVRSAIASLKPTYRHATLAAAMQHAHRLLTDSYAQRHIFVLSDLAAHGWTEELDRVAREIQLHLLDLDRDAVKENLAVTDLSASPSAAPGIRSTKIVAHVCNYSGKRRTVPIKLHLDGQQMARGMLTVAPWGCENKIFHHAFSRGGLHRASAELEPDILEEDNQRYLLLELESPIQILIVNGDPRPVRHRDELFYLDTALQVPSMGGQSMVSKMVTTGELSQILFDPYDVIIFCNVSTIPESRMAALESYVRRGGGVLITMGEKVDAERLNRLLGPLLPQPLRGPQTAAPPRSGDSALRVGRVDLNHPLISSFWSASNQGGVRSARFFRVFRLRPAMQGDRRVIIWFDDGSPALVESQLGQGHVLLFVSTIDRDWNDLPIRPGYLPLVQQMVRYLGRVPLHKTRRSVEVGSVVSYKVSANSRRVRLVDPGGGERIWSQRKLAHKPQLEIFVGQPGFYQLSAAGVDGVMRPMDRESFAANVNAKESDLRPYRPAVQSQHGSAVVRARRRVELWPAIGALMLLLLLAEAFIIRRG